MWPSGGTGLHGGLKIRGMLSFWVRIPAGLPKIKTGNPVFISF